MEPAVFHDGFLDPALKCRGILFALQPPDFQGADLADTVSGNVCKLLILRIPRQEADSLCHFLFHGKPSEQIRRSVCRG